MSSNSSSMLKVRARDAACWDEDAAMSGPTTMQVSTKLQGSSTIAANDGITMLQVQSGDAVSWTHKMLQSQLAQMQA